jgi:hypothetical protein
MAAETAKHAYFDVFSAFQFDPEVVAFARCEITIPNHAFVETALLRSILNVENVFETETFIEQHLPD